MNFDTNAAAIRLKFIAECNMGQSPTSEIGVLDENPESKPFMQGNAEFGEFHPNPKFACDAPPKSANAGDTLISVRAPVGALNIANQKIGIGRGLCAITWKQIFPKFGWWALHEKRSLLEIVATGSTYKAVSVEDVGDILIPAPPLNHQRKIADYLDRETARIDELIAAKESMLRLLGEKRSALISRAVTRGLDPKAPTKPSGLDWLGEIPVHWRLQRLKQLAEVRGGLTLGKSYAGSLQEFPYLRVANVQDGFLKLDNILSVEVPLSEAKSNLLAYGDVLMNEGGDIDKLGRGCVWRNEVNPCLHQNHVFAVRPHSVSSEWLALWTSTSDAKHYFESRAKRSTNLASISASNIKELPVLLPPLAEQRAIVAHLKAHQQRSTELESTLRNSIALLKERRSALITAAVTGTILM